MKEEFAPRLQTAHYRKSIKHQKSKIKINQGI